MLNLNVCTKVLIPNCILRVSKIEVIVDAGLDFYNLVLLDVATDYKSPGWRRKNPIVLRQDEFERIHCQLLMNDIHIAH